MFWVGTSSTLRSSFASARRSSVFRPRHMTLHLGVASATNAGLPGAFSETVKVAVLGAGNFGTAMAQIAARQGHHVSLYARNQEQVNAINATRRNPLFFPEFELASSIVATSSVAESCANATLVVICIPAQSTPDFLAQHKDAIPADAILVVTSKGLYLKTKQLLSVPILEAIGRDQPLTFLSGPSFALELMKNAPSAVVRRQASAWPCCPLIRFPGCGCARIVPCRPRATAALDRGFPHLQLARYHWRATGRGAQESARDRCRHD
ncbi:hypothetical protein, variant 3 [Aphanomyces invadans]|uniref:Glycerol-3-phosphate dehydrogenase NAD-dependent N-terminal domain-containing protein n=1 Tax=Aphanomyces invadans TaxID=157072 RepID=A0A024UJZ2_9STRA|nr:hypothetical protein, variant 2 [Aphanomyces invadans]XP_008864561.1 hypothetical protein, variant 3 [Aphanomyces invadans]ETW06485.1 hypothetical protein, variant 2 [Aphanomyces invadans]ETW06486.1 hypothetical protein, variant 3 [Aphanomyces invadans]|eukprot:XP_008864560.1 hypothetical protein, variant 2 [Aphanomyces invadans]